MVQAIGVRSAMPHWLELKQRSFDLLQVQRGERLLDVGCGPGDDARALATIVGPEGSVTGVDSSGAMITEARRRSQGMNLPVAFHVGDAQRLASPDASFDGCHASSVLLHLGEPAAALGEIVRVTRPGGRIVACEPDMETRLVASSYPAVTRKILNFRCDAYRNGWIGRQLPGLFHRCGLLDVTITTHTLVETDYARARQWSPSWPATVQQAQEAGVVTAEEVSAWWSDLEEAARTGRYLQAMTFFIVSARKPLGSGR
jgi:SAM-dependent methyltransferase